MDRRQVEADQVEEEVDVEDLADGAQQRCFADGVLGDHLPVNLLARREQTKHTLGSGAEAAKVERGLAELAAKVEQDKAVLEQNENDKELLHFFHPMLRFFLLLCFQHHFASTSSC